MGIDREEAITLQNDGLVDPLTYNWQPKFLDEMRREITTDFGEAWKLNDAGHRYLHFSEVEAVANYINRRQQLNQDKTLIMLAAFFHDLFCWSRHNHHITSATWVRTTDYKHIAALKMEDRELVAQGCEHHRASDIGLFFPSIFAEMICSADRGWPGNTKAMLKRAIVTAAAKNPECTREEVLHMAVRHLKEKYGTNGYARLPNLYVATFGDILNKRRDAIDNLEVIHGNVNIENIPFTPVL